MTDTAPLTLTLAGAAHPTFTGVGIPGGASVNFGNLDTEDAFSAIPFGATVLARDANDNPVYFTGSLGLGRYWVTNVELTESGANVDEKQLAHNAIHFVAPTTVPEPSTLVFLALGLGLVAIRVKRPSN